MGPEPGAGAAAPWYEEAFRADYLRVYPHRDLESARPEVEFLRARGVGGRVLDLCCGFGRHALLLSQGGADVVGADLSAELLAAARTLPGYERWLSGRLVRADMRRIPFAAESFDALVLLFSSFGYLGEAGDREVLEGIARVLRPRGLAVLDLMNPAHVRASLVPRSQREGAGWVLVEHRRLEDRGRRVVKEVELAREGGEARRWREDVRLYEARELEALLAAAGLGARAVHGDFDGSPESARAPRRIVEARRL